MSILKSAPRKLWSFLNVINSIVPKNDRKIFLYSNLGFRDNVRAVYDYLIENGVDVTGDTPLREKIKWLNQINGTSTKVLHDGAEYTVDGLIQKRNEKGTYITVVLKPCNGANSLSYVRVQDIERER